MQLNIDRIDPRSVPYSTEIDPDSGQTTAFNDDLRVMAIGDSEEAAIEGFYEAVVALAEFEIGAGRPLPAALLQVHA